MPLWDRLGHGWWWGLMVLLVGCGPSTPSPPERSAFTPVPRPGMDWWVRHHNEHVARAMAAPIDLLFLGDSITQGWHGRGRDLYDGDGWVFWRRLYFPRRAANFGLSSDRTEHLLWRVKHGALPARCPKVVVLLIGTNNLRADPPDEIAKGVVAILDVIQQRCPSARVLLLGLFPRGVSTRTERFVDEPDSRVDLVNARLTEIGNRPGVTYLDIGSEFLSPDGTLSRTVMPDFLHLSREGYRRWAVAMEPTLRLLLDE